MKPTKPTLVRWQDVKMHVRGIIKVVSEVEVTVYPDGKIAMSFEEYNRILEDKTTGPRILLPAKS